MSINDICTIIVLKTPNENVFYLIYVKIYKNKKYTS